jgi:hypothetical protein
MALTSKGSFGDRPRQQPHASNDSKSCRGAKISHPEGIRVRSGRI